MPSHASSSILCLLVSHPLCKKKKKMSAFSEKVLQRLVDGMVAVYEEPSTVPGFAPSVKEYSGKFLPPQWNPIPTATFVYKHKSRPGRLFTATFAMRGEQQVHCAMSMRGGETVSMDVTNEDHWECIPSADCDQWTAQYKNVDTLMDSFLGLIGGLIPQMIATQPQADMNNSSTSCSSEVPAISVPVLHAVPSVSSANYRAVNVGSSDLDPFPAHALPPFLGPNAPSISSPQGGMLVGPEHGMFSGQVPDFHSDPDGMFYPPGARPPFLPGFAVPQPRFDPFGPPIDPNSEIGIDPSGRGRGLGRGAGRRWPGEPNPDHLRPPGW